MRSDGALTTAEMLEAFTEEIAAKDGRVIDTYNDGVRLLARSVLAHEEDVQRGDRVQGGVAIRACEDDIRLHPYVYRFVCRNGAIMAHAIETRQVTDLALHGPQGATYLLREAVAACCAPEVFAHSVDQMREARHSEVDAVINLLPMLAHIQSVEGMRGIAARILDRYLQDADGAGNDAGDRSRFALMNAVTSVARDIRGNADTRWRLEELGGAIAAGLISPAPQRDASAALGAPRRRDAALSIR